MVAKKLMNVHEALEYLENLDVSLEDDLSDDGDLISRRWLVILPSNNEGDRNTDEDSEDENELLPNNISRSKLLAGAAVDLSASSGNILLGVGDKEEVPDPSINVPSKWNERSKVHALL